MKWPIWLIWWGGTCRKTKNEFGYKSKLPSLIMHRVPIHKLWNKISKFQIWRSDIWVQWSHDCFNLTDDNQWRKSNNSFTTLTKRKKMLAFIVTALVTANTTIWPDYYGEYYDYGGNATSDVKLIECTYQCSIHLYFQCAMTIEGFWCFYFGLNRKIKFKRWKR